MSFDSADTEFSSANHISTCENSEMNFSKNINIEGKIW